MKAFRFSLFLILYSWLIIAAISPVLAKEGCDVVPDTEFNGPQFYLPSDAASRKCNTPSFERQVFELERSSAIPIDSASSLMSGVISENIKNNLEFFPKFLSGNSTFSFESYDGFGLRNEVQSQLPPELANYIGRAINIPDQYDPTLGDALCVYHNILNYTDCSAFLNAQTPSGQPNYIANAGFQCSATTRESQFFQKKLRAQQILDCANNTESPFTPCDSPYLVNKITGETSLELAKKILAIPNYTSFTKLTKELQFTVLSLRESKALSAVYIVVRKKDPTNSDVFQSLFDSLNKNNKLVLTNYIPGVSQSITGSQTIYRLTNTNQQGIAGLSRINSRVFTPLDRNQTIGQMVIQKIDTSQPVDASTMILQPTGSHAQYDNTEDKITVNLGFDVNKDWSEAIKDAIDQAYEAYIISPTALISQYTTDDENSVVSQNFKKEFQQDLQQPTYLPHGTGETNPSVSTSPIPIVDSATGVVTQESISFSGTGSPKSVIHAGPGDENLFVGQNAWSKFSSAFYHTTCYASETLSKAESRFSALGLSTSILGNFIASNCRPNPTAKQQDDTSPGTCVQALFEPGLCPGGQDCADYICAKAAERNIDCGILLMIAANESGGLFTCNPDLSSKLHFGCDPSGATAYGFDIASKLDCAMDTLSGYWASTNHDINETLRYYGYGCTNPYDQAHEGCTPVPIDELRWESYELTPPTTLHATNNSEDLAQFKSTVLKWTGPNPRHYWNAYCGGFPEVIRIAGPVGLDPAEYSCSKTHN